MTERKLLEKTGRRAVKKRPSHSLAAADDFNQLALVKRLEHLTRANAANLLDLGTADWLPVRDDGECLERRRRESLRPRGELSALDCLREFGPCENLPSAADLEQLHSVPVIIVVALELGECRDDVGLTRLAVSGHVSEV